LFIVLSLSVLCLFFAGYVATSFLRLGGRLFEQAGLALGLGILADHILVMSGQPLTNVLATMVILALAGTLMFAVDLKRRQSEGIRRREPVLLAACCIAYLVGVYYLYVFSEPLMHWDARSIWFFHAKMIWVEGALREEGWAHPSLEFSHPDYPKLVPAIAAQLAALKGYWNEFFPKGSLLVMLVPLLLWVFSFRKMSISFLALILLYFFSLDAWLANGYMDGYLAMYCGVALLLFGRYLAEGNDADLHSAICATGIAACLKNEGVLFGACFIATFVLRSAGHPVLGARRLVRRLREDRRLAVILALSVAPTLLWAMRSRSWGLRNDLTGDPAGLLSRLATRLLDGSSAQHILEYLTVQATAIWVVVGLLAATLTFLASQRVPLHRGAVAAAATSTLYFCAIYVAYLSTPRGLEFHLTTSAGRTMATASMGLLVCLYFLLTGLEANDAPSARGRTGVARFHRAARTPRGATDS
jgi:hypothetical protein